MTRMTLRKAMLALLGGAVLIHVPAGAQVVDNTLTLNGLPLSISRLEQERLQALRNVLNSTNRSVQDRALAAVESVANSPDARHVIALYKLELGRQRRDDALRAQALDVLMASRMTPAERLPNYLAVRGDIAFRARDLATASTAWGRLAELRPNDPQSLINLAQVRDAEGNAADALELIQRGIAARRTGPEAVPEIWYRQWVSIAHNTRRLDRGAAAAQALLAAYPTPGNWRFALVAYRQLAAPQAAAEIDLLRLMRAAGAFARPAEYQRLAQLLFHAGLLREARAVLDEGLSRGVVNRGESPTPEIIAEMDRAVSRQSERRGARRSETAARSSATVPDPADVLLGEGRFAEAAASYRATLQRGGPDSAAVNVRLGVALALAGRRAEAEAAFRAAAGHAQGGPAQAFYPDLARFWLSWLAQAA